MTVAYVVGLTGGIGSGKTAVADAFAALGVEIVDADALAHRLSGASEPGFAAIRVAFGDAIVDTQDGLRLAWKDRWLHVRPSGTEPIVRVIAEAPSEREAQQLVGRARSLLERLKTPAAAAAAR